MRRKIEQYTNTSAKLVVAECSDAHIANWIEDAQSDLAKLHAALRQIAGMDYANAAVNCCASDAVRIARAATE